MEHTTVFDGSTTQVTGKLVIKNLVEIMPGFESGKKIESDPFMVGDTAMALEVFPNGVDEDSDGDVDCYLYNRGDAGIRVKGQLITELETEEFDYTRLQPTDIVCLHLTHAECTEAYTDRDFVLTAKLELPGEPVKIFGSNSAPAAKRRKFNVFENVYKQMQRTDFTLVSELLIVTAITINHGRPLYHIIIKKRHNPITIWTSPYSLSRLG